MSTTKPRLDFLPPTMRRNYAHLSEAECRKVFDQSLKDLKKLPALWELTSNSPEVAQGKEIARRLVLGTVDVLFDRTTSESVSPVEVGLFLATLSTCKLNDLQWEVRHGLKKLGIRRLSRIGRPKGKKSERSLHTKFSVFERVIEKTQLWTKKQELQQKFPTSWTARLRSVLQTDKWSDDEIDLAIKCRTARSLALYLVAKKCNVDYDTVQKSVRRSRCAVLPKT